MFQKRGGMGDRSKSGSGRTEEDIAGDEDKGEQGEEGSEVQPLPGKKRGFRRPGTTANPGR